MCNGYMRPICGMMDGIGCGKGMVIKMKRRIACFALAGLVAWGSAVPAHAEDYKGGEGWKVEFTGDGMESNFQSSALSDAVYALQPGDSVMLSLALVNGDSQGTDWYMTNEVLSSLEDSQSMANGGAYAYRLAYTNSLGEEAVLYSSENVGGEKDTGAGEGLREATDSLDEFFYLDRLEAGGSGTVTLEVVLDGETQGNTYQNTLASLQMNFAVEKAGTVPGPDGGNGPGDNGGGTPGSQGGGGSPDPARTSGPGAYTLHSVKTGDSLNMLLWSALALGSGAALFSLAALYIKKEKGGEERGQMQ